MDPASRPAAPTPDAPPIWVISLARVADRRRSFEASFAALDLPCEVVEAVDGLALDLGECHRYSPWRARFETGRVLTPGEVGCALSHLEVYRRMVDADIPEVLVVEDDVQPTPSLVGVLAARAALPPDWQVVTFHSLDARATPRPLPGPPLTEAHRVCTYARTPFGTQCYLISQSGARRMLDVGLPVRLPADELLFRRQPAGLRLYGIEPSPVVHADFGSELHTAPAGDTRGVVRPLERVVITLGRVRTRLLRMLRSR